MATPTLEQIISELDQWFADTMRNSIVAREVQVYNHVYGAFEDLKGRIETLITGKPAAAPAAAEAEAPAEQPTKSKSAA